jgi:hypothetical protein
LECLGDFYSGSFEAERKTRVDVRGKDTVPVTSLEGAIGVLLYGMLAESGAERW